MGTLIYYIEAEILIAELYDLNIEAGSTREAALDFVSRLGPIMERLQPLYDEDGEAWDWSINTEDYGDFRFNVIEK